VYGKSRASRVEWLQLDAEHIFNHKMSARYAPRHSIRNGAGVTGTPSRLTEEWDVIDLMLWHRFERSCKATVDGRHTDVRAPTALYQSFGFIGKRAA